MKARKLLRPENKKPLMKNVEEQMLSLNQAFITGENLLKEVEKTRRLFSTQYNALSMEKFHRAFESAVGLEQGATKEYMKIYRIQIDWKPMKRLRKSVEFLIVSIIGYVMLIMIFQRMNKIWILSGKTYWTQVCVMPTFFVS